MATVETLAKLAALRMEIDQLVQVERSRFTAKERKLLDPVRIGQFEPFLRTAQLLL